MGMELEEARKEAEYYKKIAKRTGDLFLRETLELSKLVSRNREVERELRENEVTLRHIIEHSKELFFLHDTKHQFTYVSPQSMDFFGYAPDEMKVRWTNLMTDNPINQIGFELTVKAIKTGQKQRPYILEGRKKDGEIILIEVDESPIKDEKGKVVAITGAARDVTQREKIESDLRQIYKMESIGILAGGIAHDFNNLLMGIQGRTSLIMIDIDLSHPFSEHIKEIEKYVKSASDLTKQLLAFARKGKYEVRPIDLNSLIEESSHMFGRTKKEIKIHLKLQQDLQVVEIDHSQMEQVFLNLFINAWHAMPAGGEIYLKSENTALDDYYVNTFSIPRGNYVKISITDTGVGMDNEVKQKVFDPFFTTKEMGRGTGLGLASVYGIIKNHGGIIDVFSKIGEGTTFNIYLPASEKRVPEIKKGTEELLKGTETILLVDDEQMIVDIGKALLERLGYNVIVAKSGIAALELYKVENGQIDIVIMDMIMPKMSGIETYKHLKEINPDIKVLFSSGYSISGDVTEELNLGYNGFIQKPYKYEKLSQKLRSILGTN